jgi:hypothetical protein
MDSMTSSDTASTTDHRNILVLFQDSGPPKYVPLNILYVSLFLRINLEIGPVIHFFYFCGRSRAYRLSELIEAYGQRVVSLSTVHRCYLAFAAEKMTSGHDDRSG